VIILDLWKGLRGGIEVCLRYVIIASGVDASP